MTMWIVLVLTGLVLVLGRAMRVEANVSTNELSSLQALAVEQGAIQYVLANLDGLKGKVPVDGDISCEAVRLGEGAFWIIRANDTTDDITRRYGLTDECSKINLNTAPLEMLQKLPSMTGELAACIVDWRDGDSNITTGGAENEYYLLLPDPYQCKNANLETVEELFLVKGCTKQILYGEDANLNGILDSNEDDADASEPADDHDGKLIRGIFPFATVYSVAPAPPSGRTDVGTSNHGVIQNVLGNQLKLNQQQAHDMAVKATSGGRITSVLAFYVRSGMTADQFKQIEDKVMARAQGTDRRQVNVATAPKEVLGALPGLDSNDALALVNKRTALSQTERESFSWLVQTLAKNKLEPIGPYITTQSSRFSADILSVSGDGRAFRRCRVVIDNAPTPPRVLFRQDLTPLGWPLEPTILSSLRSGMPLDNIAPANTLRQEATKE